MSQVVTARGSFRTALWCWLTKMAAQWLVVCIPFLLFGMYACPDIVPILFVKLSGYSVLLATLATLLMLTGKVTAAPDGVRHIILGYQSRFIPWSELDFRNPFQFTLEKPYLIVKRGSKEAIKIWPSMNGYQELKDYFATQKISLEGRSVAEREETKFRPFDDVINEAISGR